MALPARVLPDAPGPLDGIGIGAIEQQHGALEAVKSRWLRTSHKEADRSAVRIVVRSGDPDRLVFGITVARGAMGQEPLLRIGPQQGGKRFDAVIRIGLDRGPPAALQRALEK